MSRYRRLFVPGGTYFFTVVTLNRLPFLTESLARACLHGAIEQTRKSRHFRIVAFCLLPDHFHTIWTLPEDDAHFSIRLRQIKGLFSRQYMMQSACGKPHPTQSRTREQRGRKPVWQTRFWEHLIRDDEDFRRHVDYTHYNPVKHGLVGTVADWKWSTFHRYVKDGVYSEEWGKEPPEWLNGFRCAGE